MSMPTFRKAEAADAPTLGAIGANAFKNSPSMVFRYPNCSIAELTRFYTEFATRYIAQKAVKGYVALLEDKIVGFLFWSRKGFGIKDKGEIPSVRLPDCTDWKYQNRLEEGEGAWKEGLLKEYGPHLRESHTTFDRSSLAGIFEEYRLPARIGRDVPLLDPNDGLWS